MCSRHDTVLPFKVRCLFVNKDMRVDYVECRKETNENNSCKGFWLVTAFRNEIEKVKKSKMFLFHL